MLEYEQDYDEISLQCDLKMWQYLHSGKQPTEGSSHGGCGYVNANAEQQFVALVEAGDEECKPATKPWLAWNVETDIRYVRHDTTFKYTQEGSRNQQPSEAWHKGGTQWDKAKPTYKKWQVVLWAKFLEKDVAGYFDEHVDDVEDRGNPVETDALVEAQVHSHTLDTRVSNIYSFEDVSE
jgi:hypothetical protein